MVLQTTRQTSSRISYKIQSGDYLNQRECRKNFLSYDYLSDLTEVFIEQEYLYFAKKL